VTPPKPAQVSQGVQRDEVTSPLLNSQTRRAGPHTDVTAHTNDQAGPYDAATAVNHAGGEGTAELIPTAVVYPPQEATVTLQQHQLFALKNEVAIKNQQLAVLQERLGAVQNVAAQLEHHNKMLTIERDDALDNTAVKQQTCTMMEAEIRRLRLALHESQEKVLRLASSSPPKGQASPPKMSPDLRENDATPRPPIEPPPSNATTQESVAVAALKAERDALQQEMDARTARYEESVRQLVNKATNDVDLLYQLSRRAPQLLAVDDAISDATEIHAPPEGTVVMLTLREEVDRIAGEGVTSSAVLAECAVDQDKYSLLDVTSAQTVVPAPPLRDLSAYAASAIDSQAGTMYVRKWSFADTSDGALGVVVEVRVGPSASLIDSTGKIDSPQNAKTAKAAESRLRAVSALRSRVGLRTSVRSTSSAAMMRQYELDMREAQKQAKRSIAQGRGASKENHHLNNATPIRR